VALLSSQFAERLAERNKLKGERCQLEQEMEVEQESILHRMGAQLQALHAERERLRREVDRLRSVSRSVSPALSRGSLPSPLASPRTTPAEAPPSAPL